MTKISVKDLIVKNLRIQNRESTVTPPQTRHCATTQKGIKLCQCGSKKELYNAKKSIYRNGQVINRFNDEENHYSKSFF